MLKSLIKKNELKAIKKNKNSWLQNLVIIN